MTPPSSPWTDRLHLAVIMDGNGRWAGARGMPRTAGHREGAGAVRRLVEAAPGLGVGTLTLYAFSSDNWKRPKSEVAALMRLFHRHLRGETAELVESGVRLSLIGRRDRLPGRVLTAAAAAEEATRDGTRLHLRLAVDYSSRDLLVEAAERLRGATLPIDREALARAIDEAQGEPGQTPEVDVLVRTGGEQRLSDFLLWECAYAEFVFSELAWPDVDGDEVARWIEAFRARERRFGSVTSRAATG